MMKKSGLAFSGGLLLQFLAVTCMAQVSGTTDSGELTPADDKIFETGVLRNVTGYKGDVLGAEVISVSADADNLSEIIELTVPIDPDLADEVTVVTPSGKPLKVHNPIEIVRDVENNKVGITIKLNKESRLGFRVKLIDVSDE